MKRKKYPELSDLKLPDEIELPFFIQSNYDKSDALADFYIHFSHWINFTCEVLLFNHIGENFLVEDLSVKPKLKYGISGNKNVISPKIILQKARSKTVTYSLAENLFNHSISHLVTNYEMFLNQLTEDILWRNIELLLIDERQLTTKQIFDLGNIEKIQEFLVDKKVFEHAMLAYPKRVEVFQSLFHVGIHSKKSPIILAKVHDFIEVRNVILHTGGHASSQYISRVSGYIQKGYKPILEDELDTPKVDFVWLIEFAMDLIKLAEFIDEQVAQKWKTTRNT